MAAADTAKLQQHTKPQYKQRSLVKMPGGRSADDEEVYYIIHWFVFDLMFLFRFPWMISALLTKNLTNMFRLDFAENSR